ncbi:hypothetical protein Tco_0793981 [Tanacetum coccineum]
MELMEKRRKHFVALRAQEKRNRPPTKAQKRSQMSTYLKHMESNEKKVEGSEEQAKSSRRKSLGKKRVVKEHQQESPKRQKLEDDKETDEHEEVEVDDTAKLKKHLVIKNDDDIAIDAIPLATKPPMIVEYKLLKERIMIHYQLIRADESSKRYSLMIKMLQDIDREDLETLWKLVKAKHGDTRPEDEHERVLLGDFKVMFEPDIRSKVWRELQGYTVQLRFQGNECLPHSSCFDIDLELEMKSTHFDACQTAAPSEPFSTVNIILFQTFSTIKAKYTYIQPRIVGSHREALVATAQTMQDPYYQTPKHHKSYAPTSKATLPTRSHAATRYKGKEIAKPITPPSESASEEDSDPEQAQKDKDMQKNLALIAKRTVWESEAIKVVGDRETEGGPSSATVWDNRALTTRNFVIMPRMQKSQNGHDEEIDEQIWKPLQLHAKIQEVQMQDSTLTLSALNMKWVIRIVHS